MWYHHQCSKMMIPFKMNGFHADEQAQGHGVRTTRGEKRQQREIDEQPVFRLFCVCHETGLENILLPSCTLWEKKTCETAAEVQLRSSDTGCGKLSLTRDSRREEVPRQHMILVGPFLKCCIQLQTIQSSLWTLKKTSEENHRMTYVWKLPYSEIRAHLNLISLVIKE